MAGDGETRAAAAGKGRALQAQCIYAATLLILCACGHKEVVKEEVHSQVMKRAALILIRPLAWPEGCWRG